MPFPAIDLLFSTADTAAAWGWPGLLLRPVGFTLGAGWSGFTFGLVWFTFGARLLYFWAGLVDFGAGLVE